MLFRTFVCMGYDVTNKDISCNILQFLLYSCHLFISAVWCETCFCPFYQNTSCVRRMYLWKDDAVSSAVNWST